jgi:hypothetical protein
MAAVAVMLGMDMVAKCIRNRLLWLWYRKISKYPWLYYTGIHLYQLGTRPILLAVLL